MDLEKQFVHKGVLITRWEYEAMPCSMCASAIDDDTMQAIAKDTYELLISNGWEDAQIKKYLGESTNEESDDYVGNGIKDDFWRFMEKAAIERGMEYYEDMDSDLQVVSGLS